MNGGWVGKNGTQMSRMETDSSAFDEKGRITLGLLNAVEGDASASQRKIAKDLGIALGLTNAYLKRCVKKGWIKVSQAPANRYAYYLTPKGFSEKSRLTAFYLSQSFRFFRRARTEGDLLFGHCEQQGWTRVILYGLSDLTEIMSLCARDSKVTLVGIVDDKADEQHFAGLDVRRELSAFGAVDAVIICRIDDPQGAYDFVRSRFPSERVLAPAFFHVSDRPVRSEAGSS